MSWKLQQSVWRLTACRGGGYLLLEDACTNTRRPVAYFLRDTHLDMRVNHVGYPICYAFERYDEVPETMPLDFLEDGVTWVAPNISSSAGKLGAEDLEIKNWLLQFVWASKEIQAVIYKLSVCIDNS